MRKTPRLSIPTRIFLGFALVLSAFGGVAGASLLQHQQRAATLRLVNEGYVPLALDLNEARQTQGQISRLVSRIIDERDVSAAARSDLDRSRSGRRQLIDRTVHRIELVERLEPEPTDRRMLSDLRARLDRVRTAYMGEARLDEFFRGIEVLARSPGDEPRIVRSVRRQEQQTAATLQRATRDLKDYLAALVRRAEADEERSVYVFAALALLALVVGVVVTWWSQRLLSPLPVLQERVVAVARGDFARRLEPSTDDEIGRLAAEFERMVDAIAARDTRLREAAETLRALQRMQEQIVAGLRAAVVVVDGEGVVRSANPAARTLLGVSRAAVGASIASTRLLERLAPLEDAVEEVASATVERATLAARPLSPVPGTGTDEVRYVDVLVTPFGGEDVATPPRSVLVVVEDVTEELRTKQRLIHTERLAAIGRMAAHVTHEVRNPLSSIRLNVEMLDEEIAEAGASGESQELLRSIHREIDRLTAFTEEYLRLARLPRPRLEPENIVALVAAVVRFVSAEMQAAGVEVVLESDPDLPAVAVDEAQIRHALLNLLRNAREAMPGGGRVAIETRAREGGVAVRVTDRGAGIAREERDHIFELFYTTKERGTGLGLPLTQQIISAHGGRIRCDSEIGVGTSFEIWLPRAAPAAAESEGDDAIEGGDGAELRGAGAAGK